MCKAFSSDFSLSTVMYKAEALDGGLSISLSHMLGERPPFDQLRTRNARNASITAAAVRIKPQAAAIRRGIPRVGANTTPPITTLRGKAQPIMDVDVFVRLSRDLSVSAKAVSAVFRASFAAQ